MPRYPWLEWAFAYDYSRHYCDSGWATFDYPFARWAEEEGFRLDFLTQYDLHGDPGCLEPYRVAVIVGHDEYWSWQMRDAVDAFVDGGGNVARFAGNFLWQIPLDCAKHLLRLIDQRFAGHEPLDRDRGVDDDHERKSRNISRVVPVAGGSNLSCLRRATTSRRRSSASRSTNRSR